MRRAFRIAVLLQLLAGGCGPSRTDVEAARALMREIESNKALIRYNHSECLAAVRAAKSAEESVNRARDFPFCVTWREAESRRTELERRLRDLCTPRREACDRARSLERAGR